MANARSFDLAVVVDDDADIALAARLVLRAQFHEVVALRHPQELMPFLASNDPDIILLDLNFERGATDGAEGFRWLPLILEKDPDAAIVIITAHGGVTIAVDAIKRGAADFVTKPWSNERLLATALSAASLRQTRRAVHTERHRAAEIATPIGDFQLLGRSPAMKRVSALIDRAAPTDANVLILGENGTGKELVARELHRRSRRAAAAMVSVDLGAVTETLFESELFGHAKGAFTDAKAERIGRLQAGNGGTVFLDEIGNLPLHLQPKLLTALERREVTPVGSNRPIAIDIRLISATNMAVRNPAHEDVFRQDLLYRLNTVEIELPPLRERRDDIPLLLAHYLGLYERKYGAPRRRLAQPVTDALTEYDWPGNVRALRHASERAVILAEGDDYLLDDFPLSRREQQTTISMAAVVPLAGDLNLERAERQMVERALHKHHFNISLAAAELGLTRASLYRRMEKHGL
ncbi:MAG: sigma-54-dependent transcriptional regulator [Sphingomicrobium sp.]|nr:sigma-54 dependent transcriptional regulator [Sphingomonadales bacterium]